MIFTFFVQHATVHVFVDDNTLSSFAKTFDKLKEILESESECEIEWFTRNGIFVILINLKLSLLTKSFHKIENIFGL